MTYELDPISQRVIAKNKVRIEKAIKANLKKPFNIDNELDRQIVFKGLKEGFEGSAEYLELAKTVENLNKSIKAHRRAYQQLVFSSIANVGDSLRGLAGIILMKELAIKREGVKGYSLLDCKDLYQRFINCINVEGREGVRIICDRYWQNYNALLSKKSTDKDDVVEVHQRFSVFAGRMRLTKTPTQRQKFKLEPIGDDVTEEHFILLKMMVLKQIGHLGIRPATTTFHRELKVLLRQRDTQQKELLEIRNRDIKSNASKQELDVKW